MSQRWRVLRFEVWIQLAWSLNPPVRIRGTKLQRHQKLMALQTDTDHLYTVSGNKLHHPALKNVWITELPMRIGNHCSLHLFCFCPKSETRNSILKTFHYPIPHSTVSLIWNLTPVYQCISSTYLCYFQLCKSDSLFFKDLGSSSISSIGKCDERCVWFHYTLTLKQQWTSQHFQDLMWLYSSKRYCAVIYKGLKGGTVSLANL